MGNVSYVILACALLVFPVLFAQNYFLAFLSQLIQLRILQVHLDGKSGHDTKQAGGIPLVVSLCALPFRYPHAVRADAP